MQHQNNHNKPFLIVAFTCIFLLLISVVIPQKFWKNNNLSAVHIFSDLETLANPRYNAAHNKKKMGPPLKQLVKDTIETNKDVAIIIRNDIGIEHPDTLKIQNGMDAFLASLNQQYSNKNRKVRIGYFGDSMIEGDLITQTIRAILQNKFGMGV